MGEWLRIAERPSSTQGSTPSLMLHHMGDTFALAQDSTGTPRPLSSGIALDTHMRATVCPQCLAGKQQMTMKTDRCKAMHMGKRQPYITCGIMLSELTTIHQEWELGILFVGQCQPSGDQQHTEYYKYSEAILTIRQGTLLCHFINLLCASVMITIHSSSPTITNRNNRNGKVHRIAANISLERRRFHLDLSGRKRSLTRLQGDFMEALA